MPSRKPGYTRPCRSSVVDVSRKTTCVDECRSDGDRRMATRAEIYPGFQLVARILATFPDCLARAPNIKRDSCSLPLSVSCGDARQDNNVTRRGTVETPFDVRPPRVYFEGGRDFTDAEGGNFFECVLKLFDSRSRSGTNVEISFSFCCR